MKLNIKLSLCHVGLLLLLSGYSLTATAEEIPIETTARAPAIALESAMQVEETELTESVTLSVSAETKPSMAEKINQLIEIPPGRRVSLGLCDGS